MEGSNSLPEHFLCDGIQEMVQPGNNYCPPQTHWNRIQTEKHLYVKNSLVLKIGQLIKF